MRVGLRIKYISLMNDSICCIGRKHFLSRLARFWPERLANNYVGEPNREPSSTTGRDAEPSSRIERVRGQSCRSGASSEQYSAARFVRHGVRYSAIASVEHCKIVSTHDNSNDFNNSPIIRTDEDDL